MLLGAWLVLIEVHCAEVNLLNLITAGINPAVALYKNNDHSTCMQVGLAELL